MVCWPAGTHPTGCRPADCLVESDDPKSRRSRHYPEKCQQDGLYLHCDTHTAWSINRPAFRYLECDTVLRRVLFLSFLQVSFLSAFAKLRKATISFIMFVCPSVRPHGSTERIFLKIDTLISF